MMCRQVREIQAGNAVQMIAEVLQLVMPTGATLEFLKMVEDSSALLVQR